MSRSARGARRLLRGRGPLRSAILDVDADLLSGADAVIAHTHYSSWLPRLSYGGHHESGTSTRGRLHRAGIGTLIALVLITVAMAVSISVIQRAREPGIARGVHLRVDRAALRAPKDTRYGQRQIRGVHREPGFVRRGLDRRRGRVHLHDRVGGVARGGHADDPVPGGIQMRQPFVSRPRHIDELSARSRKESPSSSHGRPRGCRRAQDKDTHGAPGEQDPQDVRALARPHRYRLPLRRAGESGPDRAPAAWAMAA